MLGGTVSTDNPLDLTWVSLETHSHDNPGTLSSNYLVPEAECTMEAMGVTAIVLRKWQKKGSRVTAVVRRREERLSVIIYKSLLKTLSKQCETSSSTKIYTIDNLNLKHK